MVTRHPSPGAPYPVHAQLTQAQSEAIVRGLTLTGRSNAGARRFLRELEAATAPGRVARTGKDGAGHDPEEA